MVRLWWSVKWGQSRRITAGAKAIVWIVFHAIQAFFKRGLVVRVSDVATLAQRHNAGVSLYKTAVFGAGWQIKNSHWGGAEDQRLQFPAMSVFSLTKARVLHNARFNSVIAGRRLVIAPRIEAGPWALYKGKQPRIVAGVVGQHNNLLALYPSKNKRQIPAAIFIGTRSPSNWYHWIANALPSLHVANQSGLDPNLPLILAEEISRVPQMMESLQIFLSGRDIVWLREGEELGVNELFWSDCPVYDAPFAIDASKRRPLRLNLEAMRSYRAKVLECVPYNPPYSAPTQRVYLARPSSSARIYNQESLLAVAESFGFSCTFLEELSFRDQVALFQSARYVIGPSGAAFTNIVFGTNQLVALLMSGRVEAHENYFSNLAQVADAKVVDLQNTAVSSSPKTRDFFIAEDKLRDELSTVLRDG